MEHVLEKVVVTLAREGHVLLFCERHKMRLEGSEEVIGALAPLLSAKFRGYGGLGRRVASKKV